MLFVLSRVVAIIAGYLVLEDVLAYTFVLKSQPVIDIFAASGFVFRVCTGPGATALPVRSLSMRMRQWVSEFSVDPPC